MVDSKITSPIVRNSELALLSQLDELRSAWQEYYSARAEGGLLALSGFEHQFLLTLLKIVRRWKEADEAERQEPNTAHQVLTEAISDIAESGIVVTLTQVKQTLSDSAVSKALEEFWEIFNLASERVPDFVKHLRFVISGKFEGDRNLREVIQGWGIRSKRDQVEKLTVFKAHVSYELVTDPRTDLAVELENLSRDEDTETTIGRWLGYLLQIGSGIPPERVSGLVWRELRHDKSLEAFRATLARLFSQSRYRLRAVRYALGASLSLPRTDLLSQLQANILAKRITLLIGPSGSGKSALCKLGIQTGFQDRTCLFLHASDIISFTETPNSISSRETRRFDELIAAQLIEKPVIIIDDLDDVDDQSFDSVLNLLQNVLPGETSTDVRFVLVAHLDAERSVYDKIVARFGTQLSIDIVRLPQLPIKELQSSNVLPDEVANLVQRANEFGPALNLKLLDWLISSVQRDDINASTFKNDLDLLTWFWCYHVGNGCEVTNEGQVLINTSLSLAEQFTPDLSLHNSPVDTKILYALVRRDCLRVVEGRIAVTHRFVGDCARFRYLLESRRQLEVSDLATKLKNPLWSQPMRWFALYLTMEPEETETWQELLQEALEGNHLQLLDLLLDGVILSSKPCSVLQVSLGDELPFLIERLLSRLFAIATFPNPYLAETSQSMSAGARLTAQDRIAGIPKPHLWEPVWRWLISQNQEAVVEESGLVFKAAEAWLNWGIFAEEFPLRVEVAEFILDLVQKVLLPDPDPQERVDPNPQEWVDIESELIKLSKLKHQQVNPELQEQFVSPSELIDLAKLKHREPLPKKSTQKKRYYLDDFSINAFACIVFALKIVPERSVWLLRALAGREITPATRLEPTKTSNLLSRPGIGVLDAAHPKGPLGRVDHQFRKFMLQQDGLYLNCIVHVNPQLGAELLLALTISPPDYRYEFDHDSGILNDDLGTEGSNDINVCTFKFLPILSLLKINEPLAVDVIATLCNVATDYWHEHRWNKLYQQKTHAEEFEVSSLQSFMETDTDEVTLLISDKRKSCKGGRNALYWHRKHPSSPRILACFLMTLEGWLYSRSTKAELERSISIIFERADTVAMLGVLISLAKCDPRLLSDALLPLASSLQLLLWQQFEQIDQGQDFGFDNTPYVLRSLSEEEGQELLDFHRFSYRKIPLLDVILQMWLERSISLNASSQILEDWDNYQIALIQNENRFHALKIRAWFDHNNWLLENDEHENQNFRFIGNLPENPEVNAQAESTIWKCLQLKIVMDCRQILDGKLQKTQEFHRQLVTLLTSEEELNSLQEHLDETAFLDVFCAAITIILESPPAILEEDLEAKINDLADSLSNHPILLDYSNRCQLYNLDATAFISHIAPKLLKRILSENSFRAGAFHCLIGVRNHDTSTFMRSWIREYGLTNPLTQELINLAPRIARLISLTYTLVNYDEIQQNMNPDGTYIVPHPDDIDQAINNQENTRIEEAWSILKNNFVERKLTAQSIIDVFAWIPEILVQPLQECSSGLQKCFDWDFLAAVLIPILEMQPDNEIAQNVIISLREQVFFALLNERENICTNYNVTQEEVGYSHVETRLYKAQSQLLDTIAKSNFIEATTPIDELIHVLKTVNLVDCIVLGHVVETISYCIVEDTSSNVLDNSFRKYTAFTVGEYLFDLKNKQESDLRILGSIRDVWEKLIDLLSQRFQENTKKLTNTDQRLIEFFEQFQDVLLPDWRLRIKLYQVGKTTSYRQFQRVLFKAIIQYQELLPSSRNDESELLVQVLAEIWDSDKTWIIDRQSRLNGMKTLLGQLQEIDAVGARRLADIVADF